MSPIRSTPSTRPRSVVTISSADLCADVGCSYRQLDYWIRLGLVEVVLGQRQDGRWLMGHPTPGTGIHRRFSDQGLFMAKVVHCLTGFGFKGAALAQAVEQIKGHSPAARLVYVKQDGSTDWTPGASAAIVMDLDQFRLKPDPTPAEV